MLNTFLQNSQVRRPEMRFTSCSVFTSNSTTASSGVPSSLEQFGQPFGLRHGARKSVEDETLRGVGPRQALADDGQHGLVVDVAAGRP